MPAHRKGMLVRLGEETALGVPETEVSTNGHMNRWFILMVVGSKFIHLVLDMNDGSLGIQTKGSSRQLTLAPFQVPFFISHGITGVTGGVPKPAVAWGSQF